MAFATIDVTKGITGTIPVANGGTGLASGTSGQYLKFTGSTTVASSALSGVGKILQVLNVENDSATSTTNANLQDTALALNITPSATSSKIFIQIQPQMLITSTSDNECGGGFGISREIDDANNTTVFETKYAYDGLYNQSGGTSADVLRVYPYVAHLDSPNTTGVCRYKFRIKAYNGDTIKLNESSGRSRMYLFEVGA